MKSVSQNRPLNRVVTFALVVLIAVIASWWFAARELVPQFTMESFAADASSRSGASIDAQIASLQERLRKDPGDWQSYSQLGLAYLQKARETGDPSYYQKTQEALDQALAMAPDDYVSISGSGALALARHDFSAALEWGQKARQINPDRTYAYGVIADAQIELGRYA